MDKKPMMNYSRQGSNKALASDSRKTADVHNTKAWSKNPRRENVNLSSSKNDPRNNNNSNNKNRPNVDKRPKPRGGIAGSNATGFSASSSGLAFDLVGADDDYSEEKLEFELNSVYSPGSKKQNLNHLLNFHYSSRDDHLGGFNAFGQHTNRHGYVKKHKYNKEQFLQANFQFVIKSSAESKLLNASPDTLVEWSLIEQINIQTTEEPQCPICLFPPIAAKLTRCGHAYCWPCILHYLALSDKNWRKCPICYESIHLTDLKSTTILQQINFSAGNFITLQLMRRQKKSMFVEKAINNDTDNVIPHMQGSDQTMFSKFLIADLRDVLSIIERERQELVNGEDPNCPEFVFIKQALDLLQERKAELMKVTEKHLEKLTLKENIVETESPVNAKEQDFEIEPIGDGEIAHGKDTSKYYYFYQSADGQNIFLHPLNVKMFQVMYNTLDQGPLTIEGKIIQKENQSMDEDLRKKFTCLGHLPLTCQFEIVEIEMQPPMVSPVVMKMFREDILLRQKTRMRRARDENKREKQINEINDRQMGKIIARSANIDISSDQQFPICGFEEPLGDQYFDGEYASPVTASGSSHQSFANILSSPKLDFWPTLDRPPQTNNDSNYKPLWVKSAAPQRRPNDRLSESGDSNYDFSDEVISAPKQSLGDVLAEAIQKKKVTNNGNTTKSQNANKKGKKSKKMLLFATGMDFKGN